MEDSSNIRRLSKPRTIRSSSNLLCEQATTPLSPQRSPDQDHFGRDAVVVNSNGESRSRSKSRGKIRAYLYGSSHDALSDDEEAQTGIAGAARDVKKRLSLSRTASSMTTLQSAKASVQRLSNSSSSGLLSIRSTESYVTDPQESATLVEEIKQRVYYDSLVAQNHVSTPVDEDRHVDSVMAPVRRKSLYTPGIATRGASDILRKPPKPPTDHDYYYDPSRPETSPLSDLAALSVGEDGRSTPCDLQYLQLGGLQLGTLRVTNGAISPISRCRSATPESKTHEEYYTASEGSVTGDRDLATPLPPRGGSPLKYESSIEASMRTDSEALPFERESSNESFPFSRETAVQPAHFDKDAIDNRFSSNNESQNGIEQSERKNLNDSLPETVSSNACFAEGRTPGESFCTGENPPNGALDLAGEYIAELDNSPFSYRSLQNENDIVIPSQYPPKEMWRSFINESEVQHADDGGGSREEAFQKLTVNANLPSTWRPDRLSVPTLQPSRRSASSETDSGYCSHASLTKAPAHEVGFEPASTSIPATKVLSSPPLQAVETVRSSARSSFRLPKRRLQKQRPKSQPPPLDFVTVRQCHELTGVHIPRVPSIMAAKHADRLRQFSILEQTLGSSQHTIADRTVSLTQAHHELIRFPSPENAIEEAPAPSRLPLTPISKHQASTTVVGEDESGAPDLMRSPSWSEFGGGRRRKEQKKLAKEEKQLGKKLKKEDKQKSARSRSASRTRASQYNPPVMIADFGTVTESLGNSPYDIATAMGKPPTVSSMASNWHPHQISTARPKSMFGMDEAAASEFARSRSRNRSQSFGPSVGQAVRLNTNRASQDPHATRDASTKDKPFGTPNALPNLSKRRSTPTPETAKSSVPGAIERTVGERRPAFGGGSCPVSLFVDAPSVPALAAVDLRAHDINWARDRQRSQTFSGNSTRFLSDTPPVPALPSLQEVKKREAEIERSRPHSMFIEAPVPPESDYRKATPYRSEPGTNSAPQRTKGSRVIPDLWSNGSLEKKSPKKVERPRQASEHCTRESDGDLPVKDKVWESQSYAWSQRRKVAGEALLRNQVGDVVNSQEAASSAPLYQHINKPPLLTQQSAYMSRKPIVHRQSATQQTQLPGCGPHASPPRPSVSSIQYGTTTSTRCRAQTQSFQIPRKRIGSGPSLLRSETTVGSGRHGGILV